MRVDGIAFGEPANRWIGSSFDLQGRFTRLIVSAINHDRLCNLIRIMPA
jgi:hypothetical protein